MKITICGSMSFYKEMEDIGEKLQNLGHKVEVPLLRAEVEEFGKSRKMSIRNLIEENGGIDNFDENHEIWKDKSDAISDHIKKIELCDVVLVTNYKKHNIDGYIGGNTLIEIAIAKYLNKKIYILFPVSSELQYKEEILGMLPKIINDDLSLITL